MKESWNLFESVGILGPPPSSDPYAWGDLVPSCHPLLEEHHSPINLDGRMSRNQSLGSLHLEGFEETQTGHWTLQNDGHSGTHTHTDSGPEHLLVLDKRASLCFPVILQVGSGMSVRGGGLPDVYHTIQLHFHWGGPASNGSEHTVDRRRYPMEVEFGQPVAPWRPSLLSLPRCTS